MPNPIKNSRKARFQAALVRCGMTQGSWAKANGMSREHLNTVLNGKFYSPSVDAKVDAFIADVEAKVMAA